MPGGNGKRWFRKTANEAAAEELIRAAEDQNLLSLSIDAHTTSSLLDPDLDRRFEALKSTQPPPRRASSRIPSSSKADEESVRIPSSSKADEELLLNDLEARLAALRGDSGKGIQESESMLTNQEEDSDGEEDGGGVSKKEVEKVMQWAMDAARLDPSKSDDEVGDDDDEEEEEEEEEEVVVEKKKENKGKGKEKGKPKKWFIF